VTDASGATSNSATGSFTLSCVNDTPQANNDSATTNRDNAVLVDVKSNDIDPDHSYAQLTITGLTTGSLGTPSISGAQVLFTPTPTLCGTGLFSYQVVDSSGATSNIATGTVTISCSNSAPTAIADSAIVTEDSTNNTVNLTANDTDPDA
jgi:large repetitive protein